MEQEEKGRISTRHPVLMYHAHPSTETQNLIQLLLEVDRQNAALHPKQPNSMSSLHPIPSTPFIRLLTNGSPNEHLCARSRTIRF